MSENPLFRSTVVSLGVAGVSAACVSGIESGSRRQRVCSWRSDVELGVECIACGLTTSSSSANDDDGRDGRKEAT
jgi:hypothetical protein